MGLLTLAGFFGWGEESGVGEGGITLYVLYIQPMMWSVCTLG